MNEELKLEGRRLFEESLAFNKKYITHTSEHYHRLHCYYEGHVLLFKHYGASPRIMFCATTGTVGKTSCLYKSSLFVPVMIPDAPVELDPKTALIYDLNDHIKDDDWNQFYPCVMCEESQQQLQDPNDIVYKLFNCYRGGSLRKIRTEQGKTLRQRMYWPVMLDAFLGRYHIQGNFLQRCIQIWMEQRPFSEDELDFEFDELYEQYGDSLRVPRMQWAEKITKADILAVRDTVTLELKKLGIRNRDRQLMRPLVEYAYLIGDETAALAAAKFYADRSKTAAQTAAQRERPLTIIQQLVTDVCTIFDRLNCLFIRTLELVDKLKAMDNRPWRAYGATGKGLNDKSINKLLKDAYGDNFKSSKSEDQSERGFWRDKFEYLRQLQTATDG